HCADTLRSGYPNPDSGPLHELREIFLSAGLEALQSRTSQARWIQVNVGVAPTAYAQFCKSLVDMTRDLLQRPAASNFFFMHKHPGMRLRFETSPQSYTAVDRELNDSLEAWRKLGMVERIVPGIYEPETTIFGGPRSMMSVHRLFTIDSLAWLDYHAMGC